MNLNEVVKFYERRRLVHMCLLSAFFYTFLRSVVLVAKNVVMFAVHVWTRECVSDLLFRWMWKLGVGTRFERNEEEIASEDA